MDLDKLISECMAESTEPEPTEKRGKGRPNREITEQHYEEEKKTRRTFTALKNPTIEEVVERVQGEVVEVENTEQFLELYALAIEDVKETYFREHADNLKRPPHEWITQLLYQCKKVTPSISLDNIDVVRGVWDIYCELMASVHLFPTFGAFTHLTGIYKQALASRLTPEYKSLYEKMVNDCEIGLHDQVAFNPYTQVNKMFLLKSCYGYKEADTQKTVEVTHTIKKVDDIPLFGLPDSADQG